MFLHQSAQPQTGLAAADQGSMGTKNIKYAPVLDPEGVNVVNATSALRNNLSQQSRAFQ